MIPSRPTLRFAPFELDLETGELRRDGERADLRPQAAKVLLLLARNRDRLVSRDEIRDEVWGDSVVEFDQGINACVRQIRRALGDDAARPTYIETVPKRGYRFIAPAEQVTPEYARADRGPRKRRRGRLRFAIGGLALLVAGTLEWRLGPLFEEPASRTTIAVSPVRAQVPGTPADSLARALTEEFLAELNATNLPGVRVIPRTWDMSYDRSRGLVHREGNEIPVDFLLEGVVQPMHGEFQVYMSLVRVADNLEVWGRRYDYPAADQAAALASAPRQVAAVVADNIIRR